MSSDPESETGGDPPTPDPERFPTADRTESGGTTTDRSTSDPGDEEFGFRGWVLVGVVLVSFFVIPVVVIYRPPGVPFEVAFLVLPLLPAFLLGATAVWALAGRSGD